MDGEQEQLLPLSEMKKFSKYHCNLHPKKVSVSGIFFNTHLFFKKEKTLQFLV